MTRRGTIAAWDNTTWTATIRLFGSAADTLFTVPVNRGIADADMVVDRQVVIDMGPNEALPIVVAVVA